jgi:hypothetical protein
MKRLIGAALCGVLALGFASTAVAQDSATPETKDPLETKYEAKVSEAWFTSNEFTSDYDTARAKAKETGKPIFAYFTRSYAP